jgi:DNA-binding transcriptional regulator YdaS (Cro superfamily)
MSAIAKGVEIAGGQGKVASRCGVTQGRVSHWTKGGTIPPKHFRALAELSSGEVTVEDLLAEQLRRIQSRSETASPRNSVA